MRKRNKLSKKEFDKIIKQNLIESGVSESCFTFVIKERAYDEYYAESEFDKFVDEMKKDYQKHYIKFNGDEGATENKGGKGGELAKKMGRYGLMPPKMASVASSSRFCYLALRDGTDYFIPDRKLTKEDVEFEKECKIFSESATAPQLDAYIADDVCDVFVEAKCHEIFDSHKAEFKNKYWEYFKNDKSFRRVLSEEDKNKEVFQIPFKFFDVSKEITHFDIKQFVCHLLGIAKQNEGKQSKLVYMFYKPCSDCFETSQQIDEIFDELKVEIKAIFGCNLIEEFCKENNIELAAIAAESKVMGKLDAANIINLLD